MSNPPRYHLLRIECAEGPISDEFVRRLQLLDLAVRLRLPVDQPIFRTARLLDSPPPLSAAAPAQPPWKDRDDRLRERDNLVRLAMREFYEGSANQRAHALAGDLKRAPNCRGDDQRKNEVIRRIFELSGGKAIKNRRIRGICSLL